MVFHRWKIFKAKICENLIAKNIVTIQEAYTGALGWLKIRNLDLVIGFNGRIDVTNALMQACMDIEVPLLFNELDWRGYSVSEEWHGFIAINC